MRGTGLKHLDWHVQTGAVSGRKLRRATRRCDGCSTAASRTIASQWRRHAKLKVTKACKRGTWRVCKCLQLSPV